MYIRDLILLKQDVGPLAYGTSRSQVNLLQKYCDLFSHDREHSVRSAIMLYQVSKDASMRPQVSTVLRHEAHKMQAKSYTLPTSVDVR
jgi:hypothetical protein